MKFAIVINPAGATPAVLVVDTVEELCEVMHGALDQPECAVDGAGRWAVTEKNWIAAVAAATKLGTVK